MVTGRSLPVDDASATSADQVAREVGQQLDAPSVPVGTLRDLAHRAPADPLVNALDDDGPAPGAHGHERRDLGGGDPGARAEVIDQFGEGRVALDGGRVDAGL